MTCSKIGVRLAFFALAGMVCFSSWLLAADSSETQTLSDILDAQDIAKMNAVISYIEQNPEAEDVDEGYSLVFSLANEYDQIEKVVPLADKYIESGRQAAEAKAMCIQIKNLVQQGNVEEAVDQFMGLARFKARRDPNAAGNCGFELVEAAQLAGHPELSRKVLMVMRETLPLNPTYDRVCEGLIQKLDLVNKPAPEITVVDFEENPIKLSDYEGKVVLVDFWGTFCGPCIRQFPQLKETYAEFKDQGFEIIGISADPSQEEVNEFQTKYNLPWKLALSLSDEQATLDRYFVEAFPSTYLIGKDGKVIAVDLEATAIDKAVRAQLQQ
ncbi:MAG: hypothetical protein CMJ46_13760 [Planctomyces sp.]|nr:hypothetical protein [Planctomyces sp.]